MIKRFFIFLMCLGVFSPANAHNVATIGDITQIIKSSTSCDAKKWGSSQLNACACCLLKGKTVSSDSSDKIVSRCMHSAHCTVNLLAQLAPDQKTADEIVTTVFWNTVDTPNITVDPKVIDENGKLKPEGIIEFLGMIKKDLRDLKEPLFKDFSKPQCLEGKDIGSGGANTAQLFLIKVNEECVIGQPAAEIFMPKYIIKETKKKSEEIRNLRQLHQSELKENYDLLSQKRSKDKIAISFDALNIKYNFKNSSHYLTFLNIAPGKSLMSLSKELAISIRQGNSPDIQKNSDQLFNSFYSFGKGLGELHRHFMDEGNGKKVLGNSIIHGDLHLENVYADPGKDYLITLIDNESFAKSLKEKRPVSIDLFVLYAFTVAQFKSQYLYPKEISLTMWDNVMLKPFLKGYISNWPLHDHPAVIRELKEVFTNPSTALKLLPQRLVFINLLTYRSKLKDIKRVFDELS